MLHHKQGDYKIMKTDPFIKTTMLNMCVCNKKSFKYMRQKLI